MSINQQILLLVSIFVIFCILPVHLQTICVSDRTYLSFFPCTIAYQTCTDNSTSTTIFNLQFCQFKSCLNADCSQTKLIYLDNSTCIKSCCNTNSSSTFTNDILNTCINTNNALSSTSTTLSTYTIVIICIACGLALMCCILGILRNRGRCITHTPQQQPDNQGNEYQRRVYTNQVISWQNIGERKGSEDNLNQLQSSKQIRNVDEQQTTCCICLDNKTNCRTFCRHSFHIICLSQWIRNKWMCPLCTNKEFNPLRVVCEVCGCREAYFQLGVSELQNEFCGKVIACDQCSGRKDQNKDNQKTQKDKKESAETKGRIEFK